MVLRQVKATLDMTADSEQNIRNCKDQQEEVGRQHGTWKSFARVLVKNILILVSNVGMLILGAYLFQYLEGENEKQNCVVQQQEYWNVVSDTNDCSN
ncbi:hypothetical protein EB796_012769 [Bugula neritina]|uniref:Uncharacterized protein n=1 Tax=Bugula neritina TaxID=10212 RepID=A0A7J7JSL1_BUGNE|nr:hypothetical protein EB796_012769 [Bugula neritina]